MKRQILVVVVVLSVAFGAAAVTATDHANVNIDQLSDESATVTVTDSGGEPIENVSLTVEPVDGDQPDYDGVGNYTTDTNGTVELPAPNETVDVLVTATVENETVSAEATLEAPPELDVTVEQARGQLATVTVIADNETVENASVSVETVVENTTYEGTGEYTTDENGTVRLPVPNETVEVIVGTEYKGASASATETLEAPPELDMTVEQDRGHPATVAVMSDGEGAQNATVSVDVADENVTYAGANDTYVTDENGTVELPAPEETVTVIVTADFDGASASAEVELETAPTLDLWVDQEGPGLPATVTVLADGEAAENASVNVNLVDAANVSYTGTGTYETDANGSAELPAPEETVEVAVTASYLGADRTVVVTLEGIDAIDESLPFGQQLQQFKATLDDDDDTGREIASWVTDNNPGNPPNHAGPKDAEGDDGTDRGPPAHASGNGDGENGSDETEDGEKEESSTEENDVTGNGENGNAGESSNADNANENADTGENSDGNAGNNGNR